MSIKNLRPTERVFVDELLLEWSGDSEVFDIYLSKNGREYNKIFTTKNKTFLYIKSMNDNSDTTYQFKIKGNDEEADSVLYTHPKPPKKPPALMLSKYHKREINIKLDKENEEKRIFELYANNKMVDISENDVDIYSANISDVPRGTELSLIVKNVNEYGQVSEGARNVYPMFLNKLPDKPLPLFNEGTLYNKRPRMFFQMAKSNDDQAMTMFIKCNNREYNSKDNPECFNKKIYSDNEFVGFKPSDDMDLGNNTIVAKAFDGLEYSAELVMEINIKQPMEYAKQNVDFVRNSYFDEIVNSINEILHIYNNKGVVIEKSEPNYIKAAYINQCTEVLNTLMANLNSICNNPKFNYYKKLVNPENQITVVDSEKSEHIIVPYNGDDKYLEVNKNGLFFITALSFNQLVEVINNI